MSANDPRPKETDGLSGYLDKQRARLAGSSARVRVAVAAACAERLFPAYTAYREWASLEDGDVVRRAIDSAWMSALAGTTNDTDPTALRDAVLAVAPDEFDEDDDRDPLPPHAEDAVMAAAGAYEAAVGLDETATSWVIQRPFDALDSLLEARGPGHATHEELQRGLAPYWANALVQAEVDRQTKDIDDLIRADRDGGWQDATASRRSDARRNSTLPIGRLDHRWSMSRET